MPFHNQQILPAPRKTKDLEKLMTSDFSYIVLLETHISQLQSIFELANAHGKKFCSTPI